MSIRYKDYIQSHIIIDLKIHLYVCTAILKITSSSALEYLTKHLLWVQKSFVLHNSLHEHNISSIEHTI